MLKTAVLSPACATYTTLMKCSDDVPILAFGPTVFHGAWCIALFVGWLVLNRPSHCHEGARYTVALAGLFFTFLLNFVLGVWLIHEGLKGESPQP